MSPLVYLLAAIGATALLFGAAMCTLALYLGYRDRHERARWARERRRMAAYHERMAAENGRPHGGITITPLDR